MTKHYQCAGKDTDSGSCPHRAKFHEEGRWWCGIHAPSDSAWKRRNLIYELGEASLNARITNNVGEDVSTRATVG